MPQNIPATSQQHPSAASFTCKSSIIPSTPVNTGKVAHKRGCEKLNIPFLTPYHTYPLSISYIFSLHTIPFLIPTHTYSHLVSTFSLNDLYLPSLSGSCRPIVRQLPSNRPAVAVQLSGSCRTIGWQLPDIVIPASGMTPHLHPGRWAVILGGQKDIVPQPTNHISHISTSERSYCE
jgi:hypothetical protein